jgi:translation initiation factor IF-3
VTFKEVRLKPKIGIGDFDTKVRRAIEFLEEGDRIKVAVQFRGRELTHPEIGRSLLTRFAEQIKEHGVVERAPLLEGKSMHITVASSHKPKVIEHVDKHGREPVAGGSPAEPAVAVPAAAQAESAVGVPAAALAEPAVAAEAAPAASAATAQTAEPPVAPVAAPVVEPKATEPEAAETKATPAKTAERKPVAAKTTGTKTTRTKTTETAKPASRPTRSRKTAEPEASAPAPAGE